MSNIILRAEAINKQYRLGVIGTGTINNDLKRWWFKIRGKNDPFLKIGETNDRSKKGKSDYVWALKDINFEVKKGEVLGIIGKNGAGKSTLLKILSRVTAPTTGQIKTRGRIASLLEVGTGFHPEMTGRENIYLNGAILGMTKAEIKQKEDEIIEFSGCERYIDTPVKRYSSGMKVRLAFAVAAHLEPDILVIDEVLAVGDAEFQKKAIGKMQDISKGEGRTVLFVSHNMAAVKSLCTRAIILEYGKIAFQGRVEEAIECYLSKSSEISKSSMVHFDDFLSTDKELQLNSISSEDINGRIRESFMQSETIKIRIIFTALREIVGMRFNLAFKSSMDVVAFATSSHHITRNKITKGNHILEVEIPKFLLNKMRYTVSLNAGIPGEKFLIRPIDVMFIDIIGDYANNSTYIENWPGLLSPKMNWNFYDKG